MNAFDYFFEQSGNLEKNFVLNANDTVSFRDLSKNCLRLATHLNNKYGEDKNIILIGANSSLLITCYLAVIKSGNTVIPLGPDTEPDNLNYIISLCEPAAVIALGVKKEINGCDIIDTNDIKTILLNLKMNIISASFDESKLAEIIFTSGSTGKPKGVMITHRNLIANTESIISYLKITGADTMLVVLPFYYCYGLSLLHTHLRVGGSIVLNNMFIMLGKVISDLKHYNCTGFAGVPSHYQILLRKSDSFRNEKFPHLRYVTQAGGKLHNTFIEEFIKTFPDIKFFVMYGQTEATARLSYLPPEMLPSKIGSCGRGIPGVTLKVVDAEGNPVVPGNTGEIIAYGDNIMPGYYKDEAATQQTIKDGWLYTGDMGTVDDEGYIYLQARKKEIIKVGGKRVSLKEIEEVIVSLANVVDCTIEGIYDEIMGEAIRATITLNDLPGPRTSDEIKQFCATKLAQHKIPAFIEFADKLTISSTGKKIKKETNVR